jgi:D-glycero-alpha-D-manno-heptose 1-phosphate guanylyltransferase
MGLFRKDAMRLDNAAVCESYDMKAVLLVGGLGTRLRSVLPSTAKPLASIGEGTFLELLVRQLRNQGIKELVMCTGYLGDQVERAFGGGNQLGVSIEYSRETSPLGTAGALKLAAISLEGEREFILMNGDSFVEVNFHQMIEFHRQRDGCLTMALRRVDNAARYGTVHTDSEERIVGFNEKTGIELPGIVNAGVYVLNRRVLGAIPDGTSSLERDIFPKLLKDGMFGFDKTGIFIDIGTPEDLSRAREINDQLEQSATINVARKSGK